MPEINEKVLEKLNSGREYRRFDVADIQVRSLSETEQIVEGYATTFNQPYELFSDDGFTVMEEIDSRAFEGCDMSDVIFLFDHTGRVLARLKNGTLQLTVDDHGLKVRANLAGTEAGRSLFKEIQDGYVDKMSFSFTIGQDSRTCTEDHETGNVTILRSILKVKKLYDVSAVSIPANDATEISARSFCEGVIAELKEQERLDADKKQERERLKEEIRQLLSTQEGAV